MRKTLKLLLAQALVVALLAGCGSSNEETTENDTNTNQNIEQNVEDNKEEIAFELPEHYQGIDEDIAKAFVSVQNMVDFLYVPNMPLDADMLEGFYGITSELYTDFYGEVPMMSNQSDQLIIFKTEGTSEELISALTEYLDTQRANQSQYPSTLDKLEVAVIGVSGDFVYLNMLSSYPENEADFDQTAIMEFYTTTIDVVSDEIERVLAGGEPNPYIEREENEEEFNPEAGLGEFQEPAGVPSDVIVDPSQTQPATPPEGEGMPGGENMGIAPDGEMPPIGEATEGHAPEGGAMPQIGEATDGQAPANARVQPQ